MAILNDIWHTVISDNFILRAGEKGMLHPVSWVYVCQMMGYEEIQNSYKLITYNVAKTLHLGTSYGIKEGNSANLIILNARDFYQALNEKSSVLYSIRNGKILYEEEPGKKVFHI